MDDVCLTAGVGGGERWDVVFSSIGDTPVWVVLTARFGLRASKRRLGVGGERSPNKPLKKKLAALVKRKEMNDLVGDFYGCINFRIMAHQRDSGR